jgi:hypothetical protein
VPDKEEKQKWWFWVMLGIGIIAVFCMAWGGG